MKRTDRPPFQYSISGLMLLVSHLALVIWCSIYVSPMVLPFAAFVILVLVASVLGK